MDIQKFAFIIAAATAQEVKKLLKKADMTVYNEGFEINKTPLSVMGDETTVWEISVKGGGQINHHTLKTNCKFESTLDNEEDLDRPAFFKALLDSTTIATGNDRNSDKAKHLFIKRNFDSICNSLRRCNGYEPVVIGDYSKDFREDSIGPDVWSAEKNYNPFTDEYVSFDHYAPYKGHSTASKSIKNLLKVAKKLTTKKANETNWREVPEIFAGKKVRFELVNEGLDDYPEIRRFEVYLDPLYQAPGESPTGYWRHDKENGTLIGTLQEKNNGVDSEFDVQTDLGDDVKQEIKEQFMQYK